MRIEKIALRAAGLAVSLLRDRLTQASPESSESTDLLGPPLQPGQATITQSNGDRVGVFCDEAGSLHAVSAMCTHQNWELDFDQTSRCWVCPRHGAEFSLDGAVLKGPALIPLPAAEISDDLRATLGAAGTPRVQER